MASCHSALLLLVAMSLYSVSAQPALTGFSLNMTPPEELILTFNSDVDPTTCDASAMTMHGTAVPQPNSSVTFQGGNCTATSLSSVQVSLPSEDWMNVQGNINLAISSANTFISLTSGFIQSPGGVSNIATVALQASVFTKNFDLPTIMQAFLSLDGFMVFIFNEAVNPQTVTAAGITILYTDRTNGAPGSLTLSGMANVELAPGNIGAILQIMFTTEDLNNLKFYSTAPYSVNIATNTFRDGNTDGNIPVVGYPIFSAEDTTPPNLNSFDIDLNVGTLVLTFDEPINIDNANISIVSLTNTTDFSGRDYTINNSMIVTATDLNTIITIQLENDVVNAILADFDVCNSVSDCFLFAPPLSFADFGGQTLIDGSVIVPGQFVADRVSPQLTSYSINLNNGSMTLQFTEPLDELQFSPAGIKLTDSNGANSQMLDNSAVTLVQDRSTIFTVTFKSTVLDNLKIFQRGGGILLTMDNTTALDTSGNAIVPILNGIPPSEIDADTTGPILVGFVLSSPEQGQLTLSFDEAIDTSSIDLTTITLTSLNLIKVVAQGRSALNLVVNESALADISGNLINPVPLSSAIQPSQLNADLTPPQMTRFMARPPSSRSILMFFDEYVIPSSFDGSRLKLSMNTLDFVIPYNISYFTTGTVSGEVSDMITFMFSGAESLLNLSPSIRQLSSTAISD
ncbi:uncharacterized protein LOC135337906 [Halichondria panicea]|uniref:uncharacterized protein LOC135337906 n=1 Tax=Halichondria panicea TaxID=6063 RepID=UPI00312B884E